MSNKKLLIPLIAVMLFGVIGIVYAAYTPTCTFDNPSANGATLRGSTQNISVSWTPACGRTDCGSANSSNVTYVTFEYRITSGTWYNLANKTLLGSIGDNTTTLNATIYNTTWPKDNAGTGYCFDSKTYELRANMKNKTGDSVCTAVTRTALKCDNTKPQCSIKLPASSTMYTTGQTVLADIGNASSDCRWTIGNQYTGTINGSTAGREDCYYTFQSGVPAEKTYEKITLTVEDQSDNSSSCTATYVRFDDDEPNALKPALAASLAADGGILERILPKGIPTWAYAVIVVVIVIAIANHKKR